MNKLVIGLVIVLFMHKQASAQTVQPKTVIAKQLITATSLIKELIADTSFVINTGVEETDLHYINDKGQPMHVFILQANLRKKKVQLRLLTADSAHKGRETLGKMIGNSDHPNHFIAGINADFFNLETGAPMGIQYKDGTCRKDSFSTGKPQQGLTYLGTLKRKHKPVIGSKEDHRPALQDAAGGGVYLVKDHKAVAQTIHAIHPRTAVGITDKQTIYFVVADGRNTGYSNGYNYTELGQLLQALQVKDAINLDGGGSSTFIIRNPKTHELQVRNKPSDGSERPIANGWGIYVR